MPRHQRPADLTLHSTTPGSENGVQPGPNSSPINLQGVDLGSFGGGFEHDVASSLTPLPPLPQSPPVSPRIAQKRDAAKSLLSNFKSKISPDDPKGKKEMRQINHEEADHRPGTSSMTKIYHLRRNPGSTPELSLVGGNENMRTNTADGKSTRSTRDKGNAIGGGGNSSGGGGSRSSRSSRSSSKQTGEHIGDSPQSLPDGKPPLPGQRPIPPQQHSEESFTSSKPKRSFGRTKSIRRDSDSKSRPRTHDTAFDQAPPNTAPLQSDWPGSESRMGNMQAKMPFGTFRDKDKRGKSAERATTSEGDDSLVSAQSDKSIGQSLHARSQKLTKGIKSGGNTIFSRLGKIGRSASHNEREIPDHEYVIKIIDKALVEQTRVTRISKQLSGCRDKTEYWMPALPWRCIDYLNAHCEEEGLYRVPGSGPRVKHWQRRFDTDLDIDLLSEEVGDPNEIASMLKAWLRELPTEIMPASLQHDLSIELEKENPHYRNVGQPAPQLLRNALSELPPFNYYLLFAITCHLSLLLNHKDKNKMDLNNLAICVGPCLSMERWLFNYLVGDWRHCWQGCYTEKGFLTAEEAYERGEEYPKGSRAGNEQTPLTAMPTVTNDAASEAVSFHSATDERTRSSGSGSAGSKPAGSYADARSRSRDSERRKVENHPPMTYPPTGHKDYSHSTAGLGIDPEVKRPRTAQNNGSQGAIQPIDGTFHSKTYANNSTPRVPHNRSRSELPTTPVKVDTGDLNNFPVPRPS